MKTTGLLLLSLLFTANICLAQDYEEEEVVEAQEYVEEEVVVAGEVYDPSLKDNTVVIEQDLGGEESEEVYRRDANGNITRVAPYNGLTLLGASFEHGQTGGTGYSLTRNGANLQLSLPVIGTAGVLEGGDSVTGANLGRVRLELGAGHLGGSADSDISPDPASPATGSGWYAHGTFAPTLGLYFGDQPKVYERGTAQPSIFGVELGPSVGFMCNNMDDETRVALNITGDSCHATVGGIFRATISYLNFGVDFKHHIGQGENTNTNENEVIFNFGIQIPFSHNTVDSDVDNGERGNNKALELPGSNSIPEVNSSQVRNA